MAKAASTATNKPNILIIWGDDLGDRDGFLPTAHGFDEFFGNLYHLNAEQEPENPELKTKFGPRGDQALETARASEKKLEVSHAA